MRIWQLLLPAILLCCQQAKDKSDESMQDWERWKNTRVENLKAPSGFLNLAGLYWLESGMNTFGSDSSNSIIFPGDMPSFLGELEWKNGQVEFRGNGQVLVDSMNLERTIVFADGTKTPMMTWGSYVWYIIERAGDIGIRLKNLEHPNLTRPLEIDYFDYNPDFVLQADFVPYAVPKKLTIENVLGHLFEMEISGQLRFEVDGQAFSLEPIDEGDEWFIIFSDETSAIETYGSGRYMYAHQPQEGQKVKIDFNKSYNPPCAFTDFATCWLPPSDNYLSMRVEAGELDYHVKH